jgi:hypothetical protein
MLDFLFGKDTEGLLMNRQNFSSSYQLTAKSCFVICKKFTHSCFINCQCEFTTDSEKKIFTKISFLNMTTETDYNNFKESLLYPQQSYPAQKKAGDSIQVFTVGRKKLWINPHGDDRYVYKESKHPAFVYKNGIITTHGKSVN